MEKSAKLSANNVQFIMVYFTRKWIQFNYFGRFKSEHFPIPCVLHEPGSYSRRGIIAAVNVRAAVVGLRADIVVLHATVFVFRSGEVVLRPPFPGLLPPSP